MIQLAEKTELWQWDTKRFVVLSQMPDNGLCHFEIDGEDVLSVRPFTAGGLTLCPIPTQLLQHYGTLLVYAYLDNTLESVKLGVRKRDKPPEYSYVPTETEGYETLAGKVKAISEYLTSGEVVKQINVSEPMSYKRDGSNVELSILLVGSDEVNQWFL